ncbi:hypothetical protein DdX_21573 [Ditylenchus destructor]|uniref:Uncharacterized protein n=1 Tax=Ditylenchus destructor TaxID=166010 RepID=A0AAD4QSZ9_9BILA|nr:hypothetical protein DdX_21573 [Ditylenchus destructor]
MSTLALGLLLCTLLSLGASAPHGLSTNNLQEAAGSESIAEIAESFFAPREFMPQAFAFPSKLPTGAHAAGITVNSDDDSQNSTLIAEIFSGLKNAQNLTVAAAVCDGKIFFGARDTVAAAGALNSTLALFTENATLLTGQANSSVLTHLQNSSAYTFVVDSQIRTIANNSRVAQFVLNSTATLFLENSAVILAASRSNLDVVAYNSSVLIANATSNVTVRVHAGSVVTFLNVSEVSGDDSVEDASGDDPESRPDVVGKSNNKMAPASLVQNSANLLLAPERMREKTARATEKVNKFWNKVEHFANEKALEAIEKSNNWF